MAKVEGYVNYSTFTVAVTLANTRETYELFRIVAADCQRSAPQPAEQGCYSEACIMLADEIKDWVEARMPEIKEAYDLGLFGQLLQGAIGDVDWREVAQDFLED